MMTSVGAKEGERNEICQHYRTLTTTLGELEGKM